MSENKSRGPLVVLILLAIVVLSAILIPMLRLSGRPKTLGDRLDGLKGKKILASDSVMLLMDPARRAAEARRLGETKTKEGVSMLRKFANESDAEYRKACVWALGEIGEGEGANALRICVGDKDVEVRQEAAVALGKVYHATSARNDLVNSRICRDGLQDLLKDESPGVRAAAAASLGGVISDPNGQAVLVRFLTSGKADQEASVRLAIAKALTGGSGELVTRGLIAASRDESLEVRAVAVKSIAEKREEPTYGIIAQALMDPVKEIRSIAAEAVVKIGKAALPSVESVLAGPAGGLAARTDAMEVLGKIGGAEVAGSMIRLLDQVKLDDKSRKEAEGLRAAVVKAIVSMGEGGIGPLERTAIAGQCGPLGKEAAGEICVKLGKPCVEPISRGILKWRLYPNAAELKMWVKALGEIGDPGCVAALNRALAQDIEGIREAVAETRAKIEAKSGVKLSPAAADSGFEASKTIVEVRRVKPAPAATGTAASAAVSGLPNDGEIKMLLQKAIVGRDGSTRKDMTIVLSRSDGKWNEHVLGMARRHNQSDHDGTIVKSAGGEKATLNIDMIVNDDLWVKGGFGAYEVEIAPGKDGLIASYRGRYNRRKVEGAATVLSCIAGQASKESTLPPLASGEHPRLIFRKAELGAMQRRAQTDFGRAVISALRKKAGGGGDAIGAGFLYALFGDEPFGRSAVPALHALVDSPGGGHPHDTAYKLIPCAIIYDLIYDCLTAEERMKFTQHLQNGGGIITERAGLVGNWCNGPNSNWTAIGTGAAGIAALAILREKGPLGVYPPPEVREVLSISPDKDPPPRDGVPVNGFTNGSLMKGWMAVGPFEAGSGSGSTQSLIQAIGGCAGAKPTPATEVAFKGVSLKFASLPEEAIVKVVGFGRKPERIVIPAAQPDSKTYLYSLFKTDAEIGVEIDVAFPAGYRGARIWIDGQEINNRSLLLFEPGLHRFMLEVTGPVVCPMLNAVDPYFLAGQYERCKRKQGLYEAARERHEKTGEMQDVEHKLAVAANSARMWLASTVGDRGWGTEHGYAHAYGCLIPFVMAYENAVGKSLVDMHPGFGWMLPMSWISASASGGPGYGRLGGRPFHPIMHKTVPELLPVAVHNFGGYSPVNLDRLSCSDLVWSFVNYPLDVKPEPPEKLLPRVVEDKRKAGYTFRSSYDKGADDLLALMFYRGEQPEGPCWQIPEMGSFRIYGFGTAWANASVGKRDSFYDMQNVLDVDDVNEGDGGKVRYFVAKADGSGIVGADMTSVYRGAKPPVTQASRHFAVDYSGKSGAAGLYVVADRIRGGGTKNWMMYGGGIPTNATASTFTLLGNNNASMQGLLISSSEARLSAAGGEVSAVTTAKDADILVVMTLQKGRPPPIKVTAQWPEPVVEVGEQQIRFENDKVVLKY